MTSTKKTLRATFAAIAAATLTMTATPYAFAQGGSGEASASESASTAQDNDGGEGQTAAEEPTPETVDSTFEEGNPSTITEDNATLTIHKLTPATKRAEGDDGKNHGLKVDNPNGSKPIKDVQFSLYTAQIQVKGQGEVKAIDLKTNEGWRQANALSEKWKNLSSKQKKEAATGSITLDNGDVYTFAKAGKSVKTGADGTISAERPVGLYLVVEDNADTDQVVIDPKGTNETIFATGLVKADPFIVALPMTYPNETKGDDAAKALTDWNYNVHVYPKNSKTDLSKSVEDYKNVGANVPENGSKLTYSISSTLAEGFVSPNTDPIPEGEKALTDFQLIDPVSTDLTYIAGSDKITIEGVEEALVLNTDYKVKVLDAAEKPTYGEGDDEYTVGQYVRITFTKDGLETLANNGGKKLTWTFDAQINELKVGDSVYDVKNQPFMVPPNSSETKNDWEPGKETPPTTVPGNVVVSKYGKVTINKVDNNTKEKLKNAEFQLFRCNEEGKVTKLDGDIITVVDDQNNVDDYKLAVGEDDSWTTDDNGTFTISGLQLNDFKNGSEAGNVQEATAKALKKGAEWKDVSYYCLKEVKAPKGYNLNPQLIKFQLLHGKNGKAVKTLEVTNVPENAGFNLPLTGGKGVLPLIALGGLLVVGAGGYAAVAAKRNRKEA
ncbi:SpaH/EbpB family LPXTG-anchored major pilin [Corynebacterium mendelii]|uniref:SpaH/EbpB family LPXTG-anchored major pilin n=1 Tax=Corynebacterium mendelii TaxID=2765362 RepID=A0A939IXK0_9CORY|nr:SpaH/EbpB family LPXTG-anchored major pilin [Corynebacterium mendelii]MBN9643747.1 SpaH/EbpB family LPXTG-anchored major pilin [Corynebacterium mendelii]